MAAIYVHEDFLTSPSVLKLGEQDRLCVLIDLRASHPDSFGCFMFRPAVLAAEVGQFAESQTPGDILRRLQHYQDEEMLEVWTEDGRAYAHWVAWFKPIRGRRYNRYRADFARSTPIPPSLRPYGGDPSKVSDWDNLEIGDHTTPQRRRNGDSAATARRQRGDETAASGSYSGSGSGSDSGAEEGATTAPPPPDVSRETFLESPIGPHTESRTADSQAPPNGDGTFTGDLGEIFDGIGATKLWRWMRVVYQRASGNPVHIPITGVKKLMPLLEAGNSETRLAAMYERYTREAPSGGPWRNPRKPTPENFCVMGFEDMLRAEPDGPVVFEDRGDPREQLARIARGERA